MGKSKLQIKIDELTSALTESSKEDVIAQLAKVTLEKEKISGDVEAAEEDVATLNEKLAAYESGKVKKIPKPTVKVGKSKFIIKSPQIKIGGTVYSAQQIKENKEEVIVKGKKKKILDHLVDINSGILVPAPEEPKK